MNDYQRENLVAWSRLAVAYHNRDKGALQYIAIDALIDSEHTRYMVGQNTGDYRLARKAAGHVWWAHWFQYGFILGVPTVLMILGCLILAGLGKAGGFDVGVLCALWFPCSIAIMVWGVFKVRKYDWISNGGMHMRQAGNLPSETTLNKAGYYEVEPDVWFNMVTNKVIEGRCYRAAEWTEGRRAARTTDQAIRALYKQEKARKRNGQASQVMPAPEALPERGIDGSWW